MTIENPYPSISAVLVSDADADGIRSVINAASPALIVAGAVDISRERFTATDRGGKTRAGASVAVIPRAGTPPIQVGSGWDQHEEVFELELTVNKKGLGRGTSRETTLKLMETAVLEHYGGHSVFTNITGFTMRRATAVTLEIDPEPDSAATIRTIVQLTFVYIQERPENS